MHIQGDLQNACEDQVDNYVNKDGTFEIGVFPVYRWNIIYNRFLVFLTPFSFARRLATTLSFELVVILFCGRRAVIIRIVP